MSYQLTRVSLAVVEDDSCVAAIPPAPRTRAAARSALLLGAGVGESVFERASSSGEPFQLYCAGPPAYGRETERGCPAGEKGGRSRPRGGCGLLDAENYDPDFVMVTEVATFPSCFFS
jgi:hypothetical protein